MSKKLPIKNPKNKGIQVSLHRTEQLMQITHKILDRSKSGMAEVENARKWINFASNNKEWMVGVISQSYPLRISLLERYGKILDWNRLSSNESLPWSEALINRYADKWDWNRLSSNESLPWSEALIDRFSDRWNWWMWSFSLSTNTFLPWSESIIDRFADKWNWEGLSWNKALPWSEYLIERYAHRWDWCQLSATVDNGQRLTH